MYMYLCTVHMHLSMHKRITPASKNSPIRLKLRPDDARGLVCVCPAVGTEIHMHVGANVHVCSLAELWLSLMF